MHTINRVLDWLFPMREAARNMQAAADNFRAARMDMEATTKMTDAITRGLEDYIKRRQAGEA